MRNIARLTTIGLKWITCIKPAKGCRPVVPEVEEEDSRAKKYLKIISAHNLKYFTCPCHKYCYVSLLDFPSTARITEVIGVITLCKMNGITDFSNMCMVTKKIIVVIIELHNEISIYPARFSGNPLNHRPFSYNSNRNVNQVDQKNPSNKEKICLVVFFFFKKKKGCGNGCLTIHSL